MGNLPSSNDGRSEIQTFVFDPMGGTVGDIAGLTEIVLVPDFAKLTGLDLSAAELSNAYRLDGRAVLELALDEPVALAVDVQALDIQQTGLAPPVLLAGGVPPRPRPGTIHPATQP